MACEHKRTRNRQYGDNCYIFCDDCETAIKLGGPEIFESQ